MYVCVCVCVSKYVCTVENVNMYVQWRGKRSATIDYGRAEYLRKCGVKSQLIHYVAKSTTLENTALVASRL